MKTKLFRDAVHGYIDIPEEYCVRFIDTIWFQRLRNIEQTTMRCLFPSARHDRFSHSLGVYYLGKKAFHYLRENTSENVWPCDEKRDKKLERTFEVACLVHDIGQAPFSHVFEYLYFDGSDKYGEDSSVLHTLCNILGEDPLRASAFKAKPHEIVSGLLFLEKLFPNLETDSVREEQDIDIDRLLVARMICGWKHDIVLDNESTMKREHAIENCLIQLLNGSAIDVDKLDYTLRDTWASGINNSSIDIERLLSNVKISDDNGKYRIAYNKGAISSIYAVLVARNHLYRWVYSHHKVLYSRWLLEQSVYWLFSDLCGIPFTLTNGFGKPHRKIIDALREVISYKSLKEQVQVKGATFFCPSDNDFLSMIKNRHGAGANTISICVEFLSRVHIRKPLWKSVADFINIFGLVELSPNKLDSVIWSLKKWIPIKHCQNPDQGTIISLETKLDRISLNEISIDIKGCVQDFRTISDFVVPSGVASISSTSLKFFYMYVLFDDDIFDLISLREDLPNLVSN